jgi:hypothetical protein
MSGDASYNIANILRADARDEDHDLDDAITDAIACHGWPRVRDAVFATLESDDAELWPSAKATVWGAALEKREMDADRAIALVYHRPHLDEHGFDNLAWSIASNLKGVDYLSDYDPMSDPGVVAEMRKLADRDD